MPASSNNKKEPSIEDLIAKSEAKRRALMVAKREDDDEYKTST